MVTIVAKPVCLPAIRDVRNVVLLPGCHGDVLNKFPLKQLSQAAAVPASRTGQR
jgi:hypothetical protein